MTDDVVISESLFPVNIVVGFGGGGGGVSDSQGLLSWKP